jgi:hypothetical protein
MEHQQRGEPRIAIWIVMIAEAINASPILSGASL